MILGASSSNTNLINSTNKIANAVIEVYNKLKIKELSYDAFNIALSGFNKLQDNNLLANDSLITIIDYSLPSTQNRLFIIDLKNQKVIKESLVAHGKKTGDIYAEYFSNKLQSHKSSLGFFITEDTYQGKHGYSLRLNGVEENINNNAMERAIVIHGANYVSEKYINKYGRIGRSFGCPALPVDQNQEIIDLIKNNTCLFIYYPSGEYLANSGLIAPVQYPQIFVE